MILSDTKLAILNHSKALYKEINARINSSSNDNDDLAPIFQDVINFAKCDSLNKVCARLLPLDVDKHYIFIKGVLLSFSAAIYDFPDCPEEDLSLAVYMMIEELFGIKCSIELCTMFDDGEDSHVVGILFGSRKTRNDILLQAPILGRGMKIVVNDNFQWILDNY